MPTFDNVQDLANHVASRIARERDTHAPEEACGIVFDDGTLQRIKNEADDPEHSYLINRRALSLAVAGRKAIPVAIYHTHVSARAEPSSADIKQLVFLAEDNDKPLMMIYGTDGMRVWTWDETLIEFNLNE